MPTCQGLEHTRLNPVWFTTYLPLGQRQPGGNLRRQYSIAFGNDFTRFLRDIYRDPWVVIPIGVWSLVRD